MPISFSCTCGKQLKAKDEGAGRRVNCPACGESLVIPAVSVEPDPPPEPETPPEPAPRTWERPTGARPTPATFSADRYKDVLAEKPARPMRDYAYFVLLLALLPLLYTLIFGEKDSVTKRFIRTLENAPEFVKLKIAQADSKSDDSSDPDALFQMLPEGRIEGAHLPRKTYVHYLYALLVAVGFFALSFFLSPADDAKPIRVLLVGLFTGTIGVIFLFLVQMFAEWTQGRIIISRSVIFMVIYWIAFAIGFSYRVASDPNMNFVASFLGYTFGVGLCEEVCKAIPLIVYYKDTDRPDWRVACSWGFASGVGFGVAEAVMYSGNHYNGMATGDVYLTRFISCVALHAIWSVSAALFMHSHHSVLDGPLNWYEYIPRVIFLVAVPMVLHGLYDTALKKEINSLALVAAFASFGWLAWCIERARATEDVVSTRRARA
jgi:RsiW-degrading membrane proteinase PrsW (M82 family)